MEGTYTGNNDNLGGLFSAGIWNINAVKGCKTRSLLDANINDNVEKKKTQNKTAQFPLDFYVYLGAYHSLFNSMPFVLRKQWTAK